ncbi:3-ketoacyl-CoA synthase 6-like [Tasmannia lanceolata]|uniref:3-ketoacyl-CoA synthase 6-like n=1 Tax=Tasmannia lanceolata TaxID=3420 RepID=UPI0040644094
MHSFLSQFLTLSLLILVISIETFLFTYKWKSIYHLYPLLIMLIFFTTKLFLSKTRPIYLVDFSCLKPSKHHRVPFSTFIEHLHLINHFEKESISFMDKIINSSGQGQETYLPPSLHYIPPKTHLENCIKEAHMLLFPIMDDLFSKTKVSPQEIDILVVNCSGFCPSPSLCSIIVNQYRMRTDIKSFNLAGMGCSAGSIGIDVARNLLQIHENSNAIVLSAEIVSTGWYAGKDRRKLLLNCLFRMGSAAVLLTNKKTAKKTSKYKAIKIVRTQRAFDDKGYLSGIREEDSQGITGFSIEPDLLKVASETLRSNVIALGASILPFREKFWHLLSVLRKTFINPSEDVYVPNFRSVLHHYCLPPSGKGLIKEIGKALKLRDEEMEAAKMTLHRFGNQSSASLWYELAYVEAKGKVKKGDRVWQLWMGSGPKCSSVVWECMRDLEDESKMGPWSDCIESYPISEMGI